MGIRGDLRLTVADIIDSVAGPDGIAPCTIYLVRHNTTHSPGQPASTTFEPVLKAHAIDLQQENTIGWGGRSKYGIETGELYSCVVALPVTPTATEFTPDLFCFVDSPETSQQLSGKLVHSDKSDAPLVTLSVNSGVTTPIGFEDAIALFP